MLRTVFLIVVVCLISVGVSLAEFQVNTYTSNEQVSPAVATDAAGNFVVVWESLYQDGDLRGIYGQRFNSNGVRVGNEFLVNTTTSGNQKAPDVAMDASGNFVVIWQADDGSDEGIYARRYDANGQPLTGEFLVNSYTDSRQLDPSVAMNSDGKFVIAWESYYHPSHLWFIRGQLFNSSGSPIGGEFIISEQTQSGKWVDVGMDVSGEFVVSWCRDATGFYPSFRQYNSNGTPKGNVIYLDNVYMAVHTSIGIDNSGNFIIAWDKYDIYAQRFDSNGNKVGATFVVNTYTDGSQWRPSVAMNDDGNFIVVWDGPGVGDNGGIFGQRYKNDGTSIGDEFQINTYLVGDQKYANAAVKDSGEFAAVWQSNGQDGDSYGIFGELGPKICCADFNGDLFVNFQDFAFLAEEWLKESNPLKTDLIDDNKIDKLDLGALSEQWLKPCYQCSQADIYNDGKIDFKDYSLLASNWQGQGPLAGDITGNGTVDMADLKVLVFHWLENCNGQLVNFAEYWPFAVGNMWKSEIVPDAGFMLWITDHFFVNNFEIWEFTNEFGTINGGEVRTLYYVYVNGTLYATENQTDLFSLPEVSGDLQPQYPEIIQTGVPINLPSLGIVIPVQGTLSSVLKNTGLSIDDFPLGDQPDVLAFVPVGSEQNVIVFARGLGPMRLIFFIAEAVIME